MPLISTDAKPVDAYEGWDYSVPDGLGSLLALNALMAQRVVTAWRPHNTVEAELLQAAFADMGSSFTAGQPRRESTEDALAFARRVIPFAARVLNWQYLNDAPLRTTVQRQA